MSAILSAGLLCGAMDITAAFLTWIPQGVSAGIILQGIASGLLGARAFHGGYGTVVLGLGLHFLIAITAAGVFYGASKVVSFLVRRAYISGVLYGLAVYLVMYWIVLPLSNFHRAPFSVLRAVVAIATHIVCVGWPIALVVRHHSRQQSTVTFS